MNRIRVLTIAAASFLPCAVVVGSGQALADGYQAGPGYYRPWTWSGFYFGVNAGVDVGSDELRIRDRDTGIAGIGADAFFNGLTRHHDLDQNRGVFGGQAGYNWQSGSLVIGVETDIQGLTGGKRNFNFSTNGGGAFVPLAVHADEDDTWLGTVRGRLGFASGGVLFYGTGGLAYGETHARVSALAPAAGPPLLGCPSTNGCASNNEVSVGWAAGLGMEYKIGASASVKAEWLHYDLGDNTATITYAYGPFTDRFAARVQDAGDIFRVGLNFQLDRPSTYVPLK